MPPTTVINDRRILHEVPLTTGVCSELEHTSEDVVKYENVDVNAEIRDFPLVPSPGRIYVVQLKIAKTKGGLYLPEISKVDGEMQTNFGFVVAVAEDVTFCKPGDRVFYGRYSGAWVIDLRYRVMNEEDVLGKFKEA